MNKQLNTEKIKTKYKVTPIYEQRKKSGKLRFLV